MKKAISTVPTVKILTVGIISTGSCMVISAVEISPRPSSGVGPRRAAPGKIFIDKFFAKSYR